MPIPPMTAPVAACIVLGYDSKIIANHELVMSKMRDIEMVPVYVHDSNPVHPTAISIKVQTVNSYIYLTYPMEDNTEHKEGSSRPAVSESAPLSSKRRKDSISSVSSEDSYVSIEKNLLEMLPKIIRKHTVR